MNLFILKQNLSEFGLNPKDWKIRMRREQGSLCRLCIRGRRGQAYSFEGWAAQDRWLTLKMVV